MRLRANTEHLHLVAKLFGDELVLSKQDTENASEVIATKARVGGRGSLHSCQLGLHLGRIQLVLLKDAAYILAVGGNEGREASRGVEPKLDHENVTNRQIQTLDHGCPLFVEASVDPLEHSAEGRHVPASESDIVVRPVIRQGFSSNLLIGAAESWDWLDVPVLILLAGTGDK